MDFYTPGVARVCVAIANNPADARRLTIKRNTVAVVIDGSAMLGLGNVGPAVAMPVMEDKAAPFKQLGKVQRYHRLRPQRRKSIPITHTWTEYRRCIADTTTPAALAAP